jgi:hypothetical protein
MCALLKGSLAHDLLQIQFLPTRLGTALSEKQEIGRATINNFNPHAC